MTARRVAVLTLLAGTTAILASCQRHDPAVEEASRLLRQQLEAAPGARARRTDEGDTWKDLRTFYEKTGHRPAWFEGTRPRREWDALLAALQKAESHGLDARTYDADWLAARRGEAKKKGVLGRESYEPAAIAEIDLRLTRAFLTYASHLVRGELDPQVVDETWLIKRRQSDRVAALSRALQSGDVVGTLDGLAPRHPGYTRLAAAAAQVPAGRRRTLEMNLDRWRWLPDDLGARHIIVNIPAYELRLYDGGKEVLRMRVVVGKEFTPTPVFSDEITYVTFNPTWNVPPKIVAEEILPAVDEDDSYLEKHGMEVVQDGKVVSLDDVDRDDAKSFQIRQRPGTHNALGRVKFVFPNPFDVYLHDTPADALFARRERAFSHGCVRVEKPAELAAKLLEDQPRWTREAIEKALASANDDEQSVKLTRPVPVHLVYWTLWVEPDGTIAQGDDVYGHDRSQMAALQRARDGAERRASR